MTTWAPNSPDVLGSEWLPTEQGFRALNADSKAAAFKLRSTVTEDINAVVLGVLPSSVLQPSASDWWVEVYREGNEIPGAVTTSTYYPNAADAATTNWANASGTTVPSGAGTIAADIGQAALDTSTYVQYRGTYQAKGPLRVEFNTAAFAADRRVVGGRVVITANRSEASGQLQVAYRDPLNGVAWVLGTITVDQEIRTFEIPWPEANPVTGEPWSQNDIALLDSTASIRLKPLGVGKNKPLRVYEMRLELDHVEENRDGGFLVQYGDAPYGFPIRPYDGFDIQPVAPLVYGSPWSYGAIFTPWAKEADVTYTFLVRRIPRNFPSVTADQELVPLVGGQIGWQFLRESSALAQALGRSPSLPDGYMASYEPTLNSDGTVAAMGAAGVRGYALGLIDSGNDYSIDGQPYLQLAGIRINDFPEVAIQQVTTPAANTGTYEVLRLLAFSDVGDPDLGHADADGLTAEILRASDGVLMGSAGIADFEVGEVVGSVSTTWEERKGLTTYGDLLVDGTPVRLIEIDVGAAGLANATQYLLHLSGYESGGDVYGCGLVVMRAMGTEGGVWGQEGWAGVGGATDNLLDSIDETQPDAYADQLSPGASWFYAWRYQWSVDTTNNDPGAGTFKGNSSTITAITRINIDDLDDPTGVSGSQDHSADLAAAAVGSFIIVRTPGGEGIFRIAAVSDPGTYVSYSVTYLAGSGTLAAGLGNVMLLDVSGTLDAPFQLVDPPAAPTNFATTVATQTLATPIDGVPAPLASLEYVSATWTATSLVGDFSHYEIQRSEDSGTTWAPIARITDENAEEFRDYEGRRNVEATYRMRVWTTFATSSDWTATSAETPLMDECALLFTSNEDPDLNLGFVDVGGERRYTFQSADEREFHTLVGRSYQVVTSPLEYRGDAFEVTLTIQAGTGHASVGREVFDAAEAMSNAAVSYVCVLDETGRRWFADVAVSEGRRQGNTHEASARIIELTDMPSLVDVTFQ